MPNDPVIDEIHDIRRNLLKEHGGMDGYMRHIEEMQAELKDRVVRHAPRKPIARNQKAS